MRLFPTVGTLGTKAGRTAILQPSFSGEWTSTPTLTLPSWRLLQFLSRRRRRPIPVPTLAPDFLAALVAYLRNAPTIIAALPDGVGGVRVYTDMAMATVAYPVLILNDYQEQHPSEGLDEPQVKLTAICFAADTPTDSGLDLAHTLSVVAKNAIDSIAINPKSVRRGPLQWNGGIEVGVMRRMSWLRRIDGQRSGEFVWREDLPYEFWTAPGYE